MDGKTIHSLIISAVMDEKDFTACVDPKDSLLVQDMIELVILRLLQRHNEFGFHAKHHGEPYQKPRILDVVSDFEYHLEDKSW